MDRILDPLVAGGPLVGSCPFQVVRRKGLAAETIGVVFLRIPWFGGFKANKSKGNAKIRFGGHPIANSKHEVGRLMIWIGGLRI